MVMLQVKRRFAYKTKPGKHRFMITRFNLGISFADFLDANLKGGKTYYVFVKTRPGVFGDRFYLKGVHKSEMEEPNTKKYLHYGVFLESTPLAEKWVITNGKRIDAMKAEYLKKFKAKENKDSLRREDGI